MDNSPNALSLGRLILDHGCSCTWLPGQRPILTLPSGRRLLLTIVRYVPYIGHETQQWLEDDDDAADALPAGEDEELAVERGMLTDDEAGASSADSDLDFNQSSDEASCQVPPRPMQKLPAGWQLPALEWADDDPDTALPGDMPGSSSGATPPDPYDGWSSEHWAESD